MKIKEWYPENNFKEIYRIQTYTGYEAYAVTYWDEETGAITVVEELPDGNIPGAYVGKREVKRGDDK